MQLKYSIILVLGLLSLSKAFSQNQPSIAVCDDDTQTFCLSSDEFELCAEIVLDPTFTEPISSFIIVWGDGDSTFVDGNSTNLQFSHDYEFDFFGTCTYAEEVPVKLLIFLENGDKLNNSFDLVFKNPPTPIISFMPGQPCVGTAVNFTATPCPTENFEVIGWDYGDGNADLTGSHTYDTAGDYIVTLTVANDCDMASGQQTITVIEPAIALAQVISGVENDSMPFIVCSNTVFLDGSNSSNETQYDWFVQPNSTSWGNTTPDTVDPQIFFNQEGSYLAILEVDNACQTPDQDTLLFEVVGASSLMLQEEPDACQMLNYSPVPILSGVIYTVNGMIIDSIDFPISLGPGDHSIQAILSSICGEQMVVDSFSVDSLRQAIFQIADTVICSSSEILNLAINLPDAGECYLNGSLLPNCQFDPEDAPETNTIIFQGNCLEPDTLMIDVVKTDNLGITVPQSQFCITDLPVNIIPSNVGGQWAGKGFADPNSNLYDPQLAGVGKDTIQYLFDFVTPGDTCPAIVSEIVEIFPELFVDFLVIDCNGSTLSFDTIETSSIFTNIVYDFGDGNTSNQTTPSHTYAMADTYTVTVTLAQNGGCTIQQTQMVTVEPPPIAAFTLMNPDTICSGESISLSDGATGTNLIYLWLLNGDTISNDPNPGAIELLALGQDSSYLLIQQIRNGCAIDADTQAIHVLAGPNPIFFTAQNTICSGDTLAFNNVSANNGSYWFWDYGDGTTSEGPTPLNHYFINEVQDTFQVQLTVGNSCDTMIYTEEVIVVPTDVTAFINIDNPLICSGDFFRLINGSGIPGAEFFFSDGNTAFGDTIFYQFTTDVDSTFEVTMRVYGCGFDEITREIEVLAAPNLDLVSDSTTCNNQEVAFTLTSNVANLMLYFGDGDSTNATFATHQYNQAGTFQWTASATSVAGCTTEKTGEITVLPIGLAGFSIENLLCENTLLNYIDTSTGNINNWLWDFGDGNQFSGNLAVSHQYDSADTYNIQLITVFENQCRDTANQAIVINPNPTADFTYDPNDPCQATFNFTSITSSIDFLEWNFGDGVTSDLANPTHSYNLNGLVEVSLVVDQNSCTDTVTQTINIPAFPSLAADVQFTTDACAPSIVSFVGNINNADSILWDFGDGIQSTLENPLHTYIEPNTYNIQLIISGEGCQKDTNLTVVIGEPLTSIIDTFTNVACFGDASGQASLAILTGNGNYEFLWSNQQDNNPAVQLSAGDYQVTITDGLGCTTILEQTISQPSAALEVDLIENQSTSCYEASDGILEVAGSGGTFPYQFLWSNGDTLRRLTALQAGEYNLSVIDDSGCQQIQNITVTQPQPIQVDFLVTEPPCFGDTTGLVEVIEIIGGTPAVNFPNYEVSLTPDFDNISYVYTDLPQGQHLFYIRDEQGCLATQTVLMTEPSQWDVFINIDRDSTILLCDSVLLEAQATATGVSYHWEADFPLSVDSLAMFYTTPLFSSPITVNATIGQCTKTASIFLTVNEEVKVYIPNAFTPCGTSNCDEVNDYFTAFSDYPAAKQIQSMRIVNRWGQTVFQKNNFPLSSEQKGWDGRFNGEAMPAGKYIYYIVVETAKGDLQFQGPLLLIR